MDRKERETDSNGEYPTSSKRHKPNSDDEAITEFREKTHDLLRNYQESRKAHIDNVMRSVRELVKQLNEDYNIMKVNEIKLQHLTASYKKCVEQSLTAIKHNMSTLTEICTTFRNGFEEFESEENAKTLDELESEIKELQKKVNAEKKKKSLEVLRQCASIIHNMN